MKWTLAAALLLTVSGPDYEKLLKEATYTLADSLDKGLKEAKDGVVLKAEIEEEGGKIIFTMDIAQGNKILEVNLDVKTGKLVGKDVENEDQSKLVAAVKIPLKKAIEAALKKVPGKAVEAEFQVNDGKPVGLVKVFADGKVTQVTVNAETGAVTGTSEVKAGDEPKGGMEKDGEKD